MFYFGYGSNLNFDDLSRWRSDRGYLDTPFQKVTNAWLADYRPAFTVYSCSRMGGVLDVVKAKGSVTPGVLFHVSEETVAQLDQKEGAPGFYRRMDVTVQTVNGFQRAFTYHIVSPQEDYIAPSEQYDRIVREGLKAHNLDDKHIRDASAWKKTSEQCNVFVYGTLRSGEHFSETLSDYPRIPWQVRGRLYNLGWFPGLYLDREAGPVEGEIVKVTPSTLDQLDQIEGFHGYHQHSLYHRVWLPKEIWGDNGGCWAYVYAKPENELPQNNRIVSGDWLKR